VVVVVVVVIVPSGPLSARTERDAVLQGTAVFMLYLPVYAGLDSTIKSTHKTFIYTYIYICLYL